AERVAGGGAGAPPGPPSGAGGGGGRGAPAGQRRRGRPPEPRREARPMTEITDAPIDHAALTERVRSNLAGAVCTFLGTVREVTGDRRTASLDYEAYPEMALKKMAEL